MGVFSGQSVVTTAGTAVSLANQRADAPVMIKALPGNTGLVYVGNVSGDVDSSNGMPLIAGGVLFLDNVGNLADVRVDAAVNGEGVAWMVLSF
jgi:hypothetical protein